jgi:hypothetical protein
MNPQKTNGDPHNTERRFHTTHKAKITAKTSQTLSERRIHSEKMTATTATSPKKASGFSLSHRPSPTAKVAGFNASLNPFIMTQEANSLNPQGKLLFYAQNRVLKNHCNSP